MEISSAREWLQSERDYSLGVKIFCDLSRESFIRDILLQGESEITRSILIDELTILAAGGKTLPSPKPSSGIWSGDDFQLLPAPVHDLVGQAKHLYKVNGARKREMILATDQRTRGRLANMILDDEDKIERLKTEIDHFKLHRTLPEPVPATVHPPQDLNPLEISLQIKRLASRISKHKNSDKRALEVQIWKQEKASLEKLLHELV